MTLRVIWWIDPFHLSPCLEAFDFLRKRRCIPLPSLSPKRRREKWNESHFAWKVVCPSVYSRKTLFFKLYLLIIFEQRLPPKIFWRSQSYDLDNISRRDGLQWKWMVYHEVLYKYISKIIYESLFNS